MSDVMKFELERGVRTFGIGTGLCNCAVRVMDGFDEVFVRVLGCHY